MWSLSSLFINESGSTHGQAPLMLQNTLSRKKEVFVPLSSATVRMYNCGPTVYDFAHIGNLRAYVFADILRRVLVYNGHRVKQVINITDVGHLSGDNLGDADIGEDKMTLALRREGLSATLENMHRLALRYEQAFKKDLGELNVKDPAAMPRASEHVREQIMLIRTLEEKGYAYRTSDGLYFDTSKDRDYGKLGGLASESQQQARVENTEKHRPSDFALWKFNADLGWESPWGRGFPGWHIECSAMAIAHLGKQIDIHTGGQDHIAVHHNNEIAQSECATGRKPFAKYWMHSAFITVEGKKISKSIGNTIYLHNITDRGFSPIAYRYWLLTAHYSTQVNFTWEAVESAQTALSRLHKLFVETWGARIGQIHPEYKRRFFGAINDDLDTPKAVALLWELVKDETVPNADKKATVLDFDKVLGIGLRESNVRFVNLLAGRERKVKVAEAPSAVAQLVAEREEARQAADWTRADELRRKIADEGFSVDDTADGPVISKIQ